jgi:hypothetical protein
MLDTAPKSSEEAFQAFSLLHGLIVRFVKENKSEIKRGFAFTAHPSDVLYYYSLWELQEDPDLIGCNAEIRSQIIELLGTYDFDNEYIYVIRVENEDPIRFIVQTGPLDENGVEQIKSKEEIQKAAAIKLKIGAQRHLAELKAKRKGKR